MKIRETGRMYMAAAAGIAAALVLGGTSPLITRAEVQDESTYKSEVKGSEETFYRTIATNYHAGSILGLVSKTTAQDMEIAAGITPEGKSQGFEPVLFVDDFKWDSDERKAADKAAQDMNGTLVAMLDIQLFRYEVSSFVSVHDAGKTVTLVAGIPPKSHKDGNEYTVIQDDGREFAMVRVHNGAVTVLKDQDTDPKTLTFQTDKFSAYGLMYAPKGEIDKYLGNTSQTQEPQDNTSQGTAAQQPPQESPEAANPAPAPGAADDELDEVPKTGDVLWELEYGFIH